MRVVIDTTKPAIQVHADTTTTGRLHIEFQISERFLASDSVRLAISTDGQNSWEDLRVENLQPSGQVWNGVAEVLLPSVREIHIKASASDLAQNVGESIYRYQTPRTASANAALQLASQRDGNKQSTDAIAKKDTRNDSRLQSIQGSIPWDPDKTESSRSTKSQSASDHVPQYSRTAAGNGWAPTPEPTSPGRTVAQQMMNPASEELPAPTPVGEESELRLGNGATESAPSTSRKSSEKPVFARGSTEPAAKNDSGSSALEIDKNSAPAASAIAESQAPMESPPTSSHDAYHSRSRSFSLDYTIEALRGSSIADIELWGTEDRGNTWQKWGSDPDRTSPFDVQVGNDGLFGFRMVIIGANGVITNRPHDGDAADMWINVDTHLPSVKITRALYGEGSEAGMLVIDYTCEEENLHERPISLSYSESPNGPWSSIASGLKNTGIYLWKADPSLPPLVYVRIQAIDRAGNVQEHRLELPINLRGLTPRGRIQGVRPIDTK